MFAALVEQLAGSTTEELDDALAAAKRQRDLADMTIAAITAVAEHQQTFHDHGHRSVNGYLKQQLNCSASEARRIKQRSRLANHHPDIADALGESRIAAAQVDLLATAQQHRVAGEYFDEFAPLLTEHAEQLDYADFSAAIKHFIAHADPDGTFNDQEFRNDQRNATVTECNGAIEIHAHGGDPIQAAEMKAIFDRAVQNEFDKDCSTRRGLHGDAALDHPLPRSIEQRKFDALHQIFIASTTAPADGKRPEPLVNIIIDPTTGLEALARHGLLDLDDNSTHCDMHIPVDPTTRRCATSTGTAIHPDVALKAMIRGSVRRVVVDRHDVIINLGRSQRLFTGKAREAAQLLTTRCGHRGCDIPARFCDVDHVDEWVSHGGATDQNNALPLCGTHDRWKHEQQLRGRRDHTGRIHLVRPDGTTIKPLGARDPVWAEPDPPPAPPRSFPPTETLTWSEWLRRGAPFHDPDNPSWIHVVDDLSNLRTPE